MNEQLGRVGNRQSHNTLTALTFRTPLVVAEHTARLAYLRVEGIGRDHEPFEQELGGTVSDQTDTSA